MHTGRFARDVLQSFSFACSLTSLRCNGTHVGKRTNSVGNPPTNHDRHTNTVRCTSQIQVSAGENGTRSPGAILAARSGFFRMALAHPMQERHSVDDFAGRTRPLLARRLLPRGSVIVCVPLPLSRETSFCYLRVLLSQEIIVVSALRLLLFPCCHSATCVEPMETRNKLDWRFQNELS